jgi:hypothetical protein
MPPNKSAQYTGPVWAAILSASIGCAAFGLLTDLCEVSKNGISPKLNFYNPTGDLSGKSTIAVAVWLVSWIVFHLRWKQKNLERSGLVAGVAILLTLLSLVATFPPFFELIARG